VHWQRALRTAATFIAGTKNGTIIIDKGVFSSTFANSFSLTAVGISDKEAYTNAFISILSFFNNFHTISFPFPSVN
jgi:hypothetical protein